MEDQANHATACVALELNGAARFLPKPSSA
jgi:hypothetical protein